jgi:hypothetical protein
LRKCVVNTFHELHVQVFALTGIPLAGVGERRLTLIDPFRIAAVLFFFSVGAAHGY